MALWLDSIADLEPASYLGSTDEADVPASAAGTGTLLQGAAPQRGFSALEKLETYRTVQR